MKKSILIAIITATIAIVPASHAQGLVPQFNWGSVPIGGGGFVSSIIADPLEQGLFYARTDVGGAYRWDDLSRSWVSMMDWVDATERGLLGVEAIAVDPKVAGRVYMVAGTSYWNDGRSAFLRSADRGATWEVFYTWDESGVKGQPVSSFRAHGNGMGRGNGEALAVDPNNPDIMFYGSRDRGLFKSTSGGAAWSRVAAFTAAAGSDTTWNGAGFSFVAFAPKSSTLLYAGFLRANNNVFRSVDGGATWSVIPGRLKPVTDGGYVPPLMPQRVAIAPDASALYITFGDGAGPHTMQWDEGWGPIDDWFNRGAVLRYDVATGAWTNVSPENFIQPEEGSKYDSPSEYVACFSGVSINPSDPSELVVSSIGYRGPQFWKTPGAANAWEAQWGSNIYHTTDGGETWIPSFKYYWMEGGQYPTVEQMDENGIGWMFGSSIHWSGSVAFDPFDPRRVWVTSGNGVFATDNIRDYVYDTDVAEWEEPKLAQSTRWRVMSHGIEETVPGEVVSIPGGPLVSVILDYDGFRHESALSGAFRYPSFRHRTNVGGSSAALGSTRALAFAHLSGTLVKATDTRELEGQYNNTPISPIQFSSDTGRTWSVQSYPSGGPSASYEGAASVAISADGKVALLTPLPVWDAAREADIGQPVWRYANTAWSAVSGIDGAYVVGDPQNASVFYAYNRNSGKLFTSSDAGATFSETSTPGASAFQKFRLAPNREGDIWIPLSDGGLVRSSDAGASFGKIAPVSYCEAVGFGKAAPEKNFPAVFIFGTVNGVTGVFMSDDEGATWKRANDDRHEYGGLANGEFVSGDMNVYGRVYMSTAGRGIAFGEFAGMVVGVRQGGARGNNKMAGMIKIRGAAIKINADKKVVHHVQIFDLKGRQLYKRIVAGSATVSTNRILPKGSYVVTVRRDGGAVVYRNKLRVVR